MLLEIDLDLQHARFVISLLTFQSQLDERYAFITEWYDYSAALLRKYTFFYYPSDNTIEMVRVRGKTNAKG